MRAIILHPSGPGPGQPDELPPVLRGQLPQHWGEVRLDHYARLASADRVAGRIAATAVICGLPAEPLLADAGLFRAIVTAAPWLFRGPLPADLKREQVLTHEGRAYEFVGDLHRINAGQLEALLDFLNQQGDTPLLAAPALLAVLFRPVGEAQTADVVERTAAAFASLPVAVAWPVLLDFLRSGAPAARHILESSAVVNATRQLLKELETATAAAGGSFRFLSRLRRWLIRTWIRRAQSWL